MIIKLASKTMYLNCGYSTKDFEDRFNDCMSNESILSCAKNISSLSKNEMCFIAYSHNKPVGLCYAEKTSKNNHIHAIYILPDFQNRGIGRRLWSETQGFLDQTKDTVLNVFSCNVGAIDFYKKLGFIDSGKRIKQKKFESGSGIEIEEMEMIRKAEMKM